MYLKFLKANFRQILGQTIPLIYVVKFFLTFRIILGNRDSKILRKFVLKKFKRGVRKILKPEISSKFFLYFGNNFRNNGVIGNFK